jgi:hypothetical protein
LRNHVKIWGILGIMEPTIEARLAAFGELSEDSEKGQARRDELHQAVRLIHREEQGLGE